MPKTKIICTIGPASSNEQTLADMMRAGMNVARLNFSHDGHDQQLKKIEMIRKVSDELNLPVPLMLDTKGPEYRIGTFQNGKVRLTEGEIFTFTADETPGDETRVSVNQPRIFGDLKIGDQITVNNGLVVFEVLETTAEQAKCRVCVGGDLSDRKSMSFPNKVMSGPYLSEKDQADLLFGIRNGVDFIAASFVSTADDVRQMRSFLDSNGGSDIEIIAKIENRPGIDNVEEICKYCSGIMVARGDLGVEIPFEEIPAVQKRLIDTCRRMGKRIIIATEMLESMINYPRPTRAEISDVANAVYDFASAIMLSGESAAGKYPVEAVATMAKIAEYTESTMEYGKRFRTTNFEMHDDVDAICHAACSMALNVQAKAIAVCSVTGKTAMNVSRFRSPVDVVGITTDRKIWRRLAISWGVKPVLTEEYDSMDVMFRHALEDAKNCLQLSAGDRVVLTGGPVCGQCGNTNTVKMETV